MKSARFATFLIAIFSRNRITRRAGGRYRIVREQASPTYNWPVFTYRM